MKRFQQIITIFIISVFALKNANAQPYGHEWINFNQAYHKFYITSDGVYRINYSKLTALGLQNVPGSQFAVYNLGAEIPIYVSTNGTFTANDYILVPCNKRDATYDNHLYTQPGDNPNKLTSVTFNANPYFLTYATGTRERYELTDNPLPSVLPQSAPYVKQITTYTDAFYIPGFSQNASINYYSSAYDVNEGTGIYPNYTTSKVITTPLLRSNFQPVDSTVNNTFEFSLSNTKLTTDNYITIKINNQVIFDTTLPPATFIRRTITFPSTYLVNSGNNTIEYSGTSTFTPFESMITSHRLPDLAGYTALNYFNLVVPRSDNYIELSTSNYGAGTYFLLFDKDNKKVYKTKWANNTTQRVLMDPSSNDKNLVGCLFNFINNNLNFEDVSFNSSSLLTTNLNKNYLIITDSTLLYASPGYVNNYVSYRNSAAGGSYQAIAINARELQDIFGYGHKHHPLAIKRFIKYALDNWTVKPEYLFLIGKGIYGTGNYANTFNANPSNYDFYPVPTWGYPGADNLFSSFDPNGRTYPELATGRLSARNTNDVAIYLEKVKAYENAIRLNPEIERSLWKKEVLHIAGANEISLQNQLIAALNSAKNVIEDTLLNAKVTTIYKRSTDPVSSIADKRIDSFIDNGVRYITFYGHASATGFDYNLNSPELQNSNPRFPIFMAYGCDVADVFQVTNLKTISENYLLSPSGGAIAMIASNNYGWTNVIPAFMSNLYEEFAYRSYYKTLGQQYKANVHSLNNNYPQTYYNIHTQSFLLQGDPGLILGNPDQSDLAIEESFVSINPVNINTNLDSFKIKATYFNIGLATSDSFWVKTQHISNTTSELLYADSFKTAIELSDSFEVAIPVTKEGVGLGRVVITLDPDDAVAELYETNNTTSVDIHIIDEDLIPIYPYEFSIVNNADVELKASTLNTMAALNKYIIEIDTTELFNSSLKETHTLNSIGGTIKWKPGKPLLDSTVYYWRTAVDTLIDGERKWNYSSFILIKDGYPGWNQSHYYQYKKDKLTGIDINNQYNFYFTPVIKDYLSSNITVFYGVLTRQNEIHDELDGHLLNRYSCWHGVNTIQIGLFDSVSADPLDQSVVCSQNAVKTMNEFNITSPVKRNEAMQFLRDIPEGYYVSIKNIVFVQNYNPATMSPLAWQVDTATYGSGNSLYHALKELGFTDIDMMSTTAKQTFLFFRKKGDTNFPVYQKVSNGDEKIIIEFPITTSLDSAFVNSKTIGPATNWESLHWQVETLDNNPQNDSSYIQIFGINTNGQETAVYTGIAKDTSLSFIDAGTYPKIRMVWNTRDTVNLTSHNMPYWRVHYQPLPEAVLNPITKFTLAKDTVTYGENISFKMAVENISDYNMDSMLVRYRIIDQNNVSHDIQNIRYRALPVGDSIEVGLDLDVRSYNGLNYMYVEANPFNDQPEQYHPNNIGYFQFFVSSDNRNPLLDVTFDGVRILDKDIVSAKPLIKILLNDENLGFPLQDTSLFEVKLAFPSNISSPVNVPIDGTICKFYPASAGANTNEAYLEFKPDLYEDGIYKLIVNAKDNSENKAGNFDTYEVNFTVDNTPSITNMLNYPNPFSTSTAFVFTLTGSEIPSQLKIQIMTVTGKVIREITKQELGPLHIGRNITQYKWDGRDQYGQLLGNGVYLYRVVTHNNGEKLELRANNNVDKFFKKGFGKMYIMR